MLKAKFSRVAPAIRRCRHALRSVVAMSAIPLCFSADVIGANATAPERTAEAPGTVPAWVFPLVPPSPDAAPTRDRGEPLHVPNSDVTFTKAQLNNFFAVPDWHPKSHSAMPEVVERGRAPDVYACGYCHMSGGQGRPENAPLAGLPAPYIVRQLADFKSGARRSAWRGAYSPSDLMIHVAAYATADDVASAAAYFSQQRPKSRVLVIERARIRHSHVVGWVYTALPGSGDEPLGQRLLEFAPDITRHEHRDDEMQYVAYVPPGSISRGRSIATTGAGGLTVPCISCHGDKLQGIGLVPGICGRSPTYLLRQLLAFRTGTRAGATGLPMLPVVAKLQINNMIDVAAYAASLQPQTSSDPGH